MNHGLCKFVICNLQSIKIDLKYEKILKIEGLFINLHIRIQYVMHYIYIYIVHKYMHTLAQIRIRIARILLQTLLADSLFTFFSRVHFFQTTRKMLIPFFSLIKRLSCVWLFFLLFKWGNLKNVSLFLFSLLLSF